jgi:hypothetical protein
VCCRHSVRSHAAQSSRLIVAPLVAAENDPELEARWLIFIESSAHLSQARVAKVLVDIYANLVGALSSGNSLPTVDGAAQCHFT